MSGESAAREAPIRIGISSCLLGENVRFDGGHKRDNFLIGTLGRFVEWLPVCPEVELGLGVPRESIRLERGKQGIRFVMPKSDRDLTAAMRAYSQRRVREIEKLELSGYVLKKDSPSCGMERVRVYDHNNVPARTGRGLFAEALLERLPLLPVEEEGRLFDPRLRENFVERLFAYRRLQSLFGSRFSQAELVAFHTAHKLLLMAHSPEAYRKLGRLVAGARALPRGELVERYGSGFMQALAVPAPPKRHVNVLQHMLGHLRESLTPEDRQELVQVMEDYRRRLVPLVVPVTLFRHHVRRSGNDYLAGQLYLEPHPKELMLRNHV